MLLFSVHSCSALEHENDVNNWRTGIVGTLFDYTGVCITYQRAPTMHGIKMTMKLVEKTPEY